MNIQVLEAILLFSLSIPIVMGYRILPIDGTPYWLFGILFALLTGNILIALGVIQRIGQKSGEKLRNWILALVLLITLGGSSWTAIVDRSKTAPIFGVHDIILQQEAAMRYLLQGKNPYKETYFGTPMEEFNYDEPGNPEAINPALYHFVMPPWYLLFPFPIYFLTTPILGYFDGRMALLIAMAGLLVVIWRWFKHKNLASLAIILTALSPATTRYFIEGRSDMFALFWFIWSLYLLDKKKFFWSAVMFGLSLMSKQTIWMAIPFYFVALKPKYFILSLFVALGIALPFAAWDAKAFIDSTVNFVSGSTAFSYPVSGYGFGMILNEFGIIRDIHAYYPFIFWQILLAGSVLIMSLRWLRNNLSTARFFLGYAFTLMIFWYFSRYFNNSHLGYLSSVFALGGLKLLDEKSS